MPPRRAPPTSTDASDASNASKKAKTANPMTGTFDPDVPRSKRWSDFSGSANADYRYRVQMKDPEVAYSFICICQPPFFDDDEYDSEEEDEDKDEGPTKDTSNQEKRRCDGGVTCICEKPAADHPEHTWVISKAGHSRYFTQRIHLSLRCPDMFEMYTFNDHEPYGVIEVVENMIMDHVEAGRKKNWKEQWAICEAMALMLAGDVLNPMQMADDSERVCEVLSLILRMFLCTLSYLEYMSLLKPDPEIKDLGPIMGLYIHSFEQWQDVVSLESSRAAPTGSRRKFVISKFDSYVAAYAKKYNITITGPPDITEKVAEIETDDIKLPSCDLKDPWCWTKPFSEYREEYGYHPYIIARRTKSIGGDRYDVTAWPSEERKMHSFTKKDPLGAKEIAALKAGLVLEMM
ncbi:conserved hypothetical protein [Talaromyces stipitatus ATCC 10500]|uniref:Uncharacterized protein n=1 Tax=Talaromyces stipitatus (strain ATCC 10500 / CBS 375.48 / QM 6759 / NRRL 1006) TaxID=441959 RepID=B8MQL7_TALSN|nr:uncharacterized protein TSTA_059260 [Talaromyces stipitatus ATCC 10500]EED13440.1 conserved hypothetical protein [Talaromyces stipitatus ATCC 10500]